MFPKFWQNLLFLLVCGLLACNSAFALNSPYEGVYTWLSSGTRTSTQTLADVQGKYGTGVEVTCYVSAASGTGGLTLKVQGKDPVSGNYYDVSSTDTVTTTGIMRNVVGLYVSPQAASGGQVVVNAFLPWIWRLTIVHGDSSNYTYSCGYTVYSSS